MSAVVHLLHPWLFGVGVGSRLKTPGLGTSWYWEWFPVTTAWIQSRVNPLRQMNSTSEITNLSTASAVSSSSSPRVASESASPIRKRKRSRTP